MITALALAQRALDEVRDLARTPGPPGKKGDPGDRGKEGDAGPPGLGADDFDILHDGERTFTFRWSKGARTEERKFIISAILDRGVYETDREYEKGDAVSFGGSIFIAQTKTKMKPETGPEWRLAVKRGRDGNDLREPRPSAPAAPLRLR